MHFTSSCSSSLDLSFEPMPVTVASCVWPGEPIRVSLIERERAGSGFEPGTFGTEGEHLALELSRLMGRGSILGLYVLLK